MNIIKFIYFDLGGVFFHWRIGVKRLAEKFGVDYEVFERVRVKYDNMACRGQMTTEELWRKFQEELNFQSPANFNFADWWVRHFEVIPESHGLAKELSAKYKIGVLTNVYPGVYEKQIENGLVPSLNYCAVIKSCEVGIVKPEKQIYKVAQEKVKLSPLEIFYTDDLKINVEAAQKLGWQAVWFDENHPQNSVEKIREGLLFV